MGHGNLFLTFFAISGTFSIFLAILANLGSWILISDSLVQFTGTSQIFAGETLHNLT